MNYESFIQNFKPFRGKYTTQFKIFSDKCSPSSSQYYWRTINSYLRKTYIEKDIAGVYVIGWFNNNFPNVIGIDIDDHHGNAWKGLEPSPRLLKLYNQILGKFPEPSLVVQSPRGLHLYWILTERIPIGVVQQLTGQKVANIPVEVKPTLNHSIRIPAQTRILDFRTLLPCIDEGGNKQYHPSLLFDDKYTPNYIRDSLKERKQKLRTFQFSPIIESLEETYKTIIPGHSNEALNILIPAYKRAGILVEQAIYRFNSILQNSYLYNGELKNPRRLEQRIRPYYRKSNERIITAPKIEQFNSLYKSLVDELIRQSPFAPQRNKPIERFVYALLNWCDWHDEIIKNPKLTGSFDYLYPYYRLNRKAGFYPLPKNFLEKVNSRYYEIMKWLKQIGFLKNAPYKYVPKNGICKYYRVNK